MKKIVILLFCILTFRSLAQKEIEFVTGENADIIIRCSSIGVSVKGINDLTCEDKGGKRQTNYDSINKVCGTIKSMMKEIYANDLYDEKGKSIGISALLFCFNNNTDELTSLEIWADKNCLSENELIKILSDNRYNIVRKKIETLFKGLTMRSDNKESLSYSMSLYMLN